MLKITKFLKDFLFFFPLTLIFKPLSRLFLFIFYFNHLILWIHRNKKHLIYCDFYSPIRNYNKRKNLYAFITKQYNLNKKQIIYLEFGVAGGASLNWWLQNNNNETSVFYGFDTFTGLPENFGKTYKKGHFAAPHLPNIADKRATLIKGLFQDTLTMFIKKHQPLLNSSTLKILHMDADIYSATLFVLSQLGTYLNKGDIVIFDEFSVATHEFKAFKEFTESFYINLKPIASVNNFYQISFIVC